MRAIAVAECSENVPAVVSGLTAYSGALVRVAGALPEAFPTDPQARPALGSAASVSLAEQRESGARAGRRDALLLLLRAGQALEGWRAAGSVSSLPPGWTDASSRALAGVRWRAAAAAEALWALEARSSLAEQAAAAATLRSDPIALYLHGTRGEVQLALGPQALAASRSAMALQSASDSLALLCPSVFTLAAGHAVVGRAMLAVAIDAAGGPATWNRLMWRGCSPRDAVVVSAPNTADSGMASGKPGKKDSKKASGAKKDSKKKGGGGGGGSADAVGPEAGLVLPFLPHRTRPGMLLLLQQEHRAGGSKDAASEYEKEEEAAEAPPSLPEQSLRLHQQAQWHLTVALAASMASADYDTAALAADGLAAALGTVAPQAAAEYLAVAQACTARRRLLSILETATTSSSKTGLVLRSLLASAALPPAEPAPRPGSASAGLGVGACLPWSEGAGHPLLAAGADSGPAPASWGSGSAGSGPGSALSGISASGAGRAAPGTAHKRARALRFLSTRMLAWQLLDCSRPVSQAVRTLPMGCRVLVLHRTATGTELRASVMWRAPKRQESRPGSPSPPAATAGEEDEDAGESASPVFGAVSVPRPGTEEGWGAVVASMELSVEDQEEIGRLCSDFRVLQASASADIMAIEEAAAGCAEPVEQGLRAVGALPAEPPSLEDGTAVSDATVAAATAAVARWSACGRGDMRVLPVEYEQDASSSDDELDDTDANEGDETDAAGTDGREAASTDKLKDAPKMKQRQQEEEGEDAAGTEAVTFPPPAVVRTVDPLEPDSGQHKDSAVLLLVSSDVEGAKEAAAAGSASSASSAASGAIAASNARRNMACANTVSMDPVEASLVSICRRLSDLLSPLLRDDPAIATAISVADSLCIVAEPALAALPLEALPIIRDRPRGTFRDFSLHFLGNRAAMARAVDPEGAEEAAGSADAAAAAGVFGAFPGGTSRPPRPGIGSAEAVCTALVRVPGGAGVAGAALGSGAGEEVFDALEAAVRAELEAGGGGETEDAASGDGASLERRALEELLDARAREAVLAALAADEAADSVSVGASSAAIGAAASGAAGSTDKGPATAVALALADAKPPGAGVDAPAPASSHITQALSPSSASAHPALPVPRLLPDDGSDRGCAPRIPVSSGVLVVDPLAEELPDASAASAASPLSPDDLSAVRGILGAALGVVWRDPRAGADEGADPAGSRVRLEALAARLASAWVARAWSGVIGVAASPEAAVAAGADTGKKGGKDAGKKGGKGAGEPAEPAPKEDVRWEERVVGSAMAQRDASLERLSAAARALAGRCCTRREALLEALGGGVAPSAAPLATQGSAGAESGKPAGGRASGKGGKAAGKASGKGGKAGEKGGKGAPAPGGGGSWKSLRGEEREPSPREWQAVLADRDTVPIAAPAELGAALSPHAGGEGAGGSLMVVVPGPLLACLKPASLAGLQAPRCRLAVIADRWSTERSLRRQLKETALLQPAATALLQPFEAAALLSLTGIGVVVLNRLPISKVAAVEAATDIIHGVAVARLSPAQILADRRRRVLRVPAAGAPEDMLGLAAASAADTGGETVPGGVQMLPVALKQRAGLSPVVWGLGHT
jgi:hypothetical protein